LLITSIADLLCGGLGDVEAVEDSTSGEVLMTPGGAPSELSVFSGASESSFLHSAPVGPSSTRFNTTHFEVRYPTSED
jgi:hypothetical protein